MNMLFDKEKKKILRIFPWGGWKNELLSLLLWLLFYFSGYLFYWIYKQLCTLCILN